MRSISNYPTHSTNELHLILVEIVQELCTWYDQVGFLRSQELEAKKQVWVSDPNASIQTRDRTATYSASHITTQIFEAETTLQRLNLERQLVERLLDAR